VETCCTFTAHEVSVAYERPNGDRVPVVERFSYEFEGGKVYVIMGSNGSGKSTLIRALAGELELLSGNTELRCLGSRHRGTVEYLPQDYRQAIFPWKRVRDNVSPWWTDDSCEGGSEAIESALRLVNLHGSAERYPYELSGGQQQLLLLARSLVSRARVILLDEPFSALDVIKRSQVSERIRGRWLSAGNIIICTMHEPDEAVSLGDEILVISGPPVALSSVISRSDDMKNEESRAELMSVIHGLASKRSEL
jgi:NitT/TauT family transport system ATP-binding protein